MSRDSQRGQGLCFYYALGQTFGPRTAKVGQIFKIFKIFNPMKDSPKREATGAQSNFEALLGLVSRAEKAKCSARSAQAEPVLDAHARRAK